jgi:hypothetical protein
MSSKYLPSPSKKRKHNNDNNDDEYNNNNNNNNEYSSQKSFRKNEDYHREGSCEASLSKLAEKMEFYAKQNNINAGLVQIESCINERETETKNRIENGQTTDKEHENIIETLKTFKKEYENLSTKINDIPDKIENGKKVKDIEIHFNNSETNYKFMFKIKHELKPKPFSVLLESYKNSKKGGKRKNKKTQKYKTENKKCTKTQKKRNKKTFIAK